jgi:hypothetical protein
MTRYEGNKALDAEIYLDLESGNLTMDYSKNKHGSQFNSQECVIDNEAWTNETEKIKNRYQSADAKYSYSFIIPIVTIKTLLIRWGLIADTPDLHYNMQQFMKKRKIITDGIYSQTVSGSQPLPEVVFSVPSNLWFEYALEGDYQKYVKQVSLTRRFVDHKKYGVYPRKVQEGWQIKLEFTQPPKEGSCTINYV